METEFIKTSEIGENLAWLEMGKTYECYRRLAVGSYDAMPLGLREGQRYRFEGFSSDPLGDTRQYLFTGLDEDLPAAVELSHSSETPIWREYLRPCD